MNSYSLSYSFLIHKELRLGQVTVYVQSESSSYLSGCAKRELKKEKISQHLARALQCDHFSRFKILTEKYCVHDYHKVFRSPCAINPISIFVFELRGASKIWCVNSVKSRAH